MARKPFKSDGLAGMNGSFFRLSVLKTCSAMTCSLAGDKYTKCRAAAGAGADQALHRP